MDALRSGDSAVPNQPLTIGDTLMKTMTRPRGYAAIGLDHPKTNINVGSALRAAGVYGAAFVAATGNRYGRLSTDTMKHYRHLPFLQPKSLYDVVPFGCTPVAVDLLEEATPLPEYVHPERAFYIFGAEDATLYAPVTDWCRDTIYVPTNGCMNLAATVNVVLYDRFAKSFSGKNTE